MVISNEFNFNLNKQMWKQIQMSCVLLGAYSFAFHLNTKFQVYIANAQATCIFKNTNTLWPAMVNDDARQQASLAQCNEIIASIHTGLDNHGQYYFCLQNKKNLPTNHNFADRMLFHAEWPHPRQLHPGSVQYL